MKASETQVGGDHYRIMGDFQPWDVLKHWLTPEEYRGYQKGVAIAYLARERQKGCDKDIAKAAHHLQKLIEVMAEQAAVEPSTLYGGGAAADLAATLPIIDQPTDGAACTACEDGWIEWRGGQCPVHPTTIVSVRYRYGQSAVGTAKDQNWGYCDGLTPTEIVAYRIINHTTN